MRRLLCRPLAVLRSSYTTRTKCAISDAFVRDCVFAYCASVVQYVCSLSAEHCFRLRKNAITDERVRDCALSTHSVFRPLPCSPLPQAQTHLTQRQVPPSLYQSPGAIPPISDHAISERSHGRSAPLNPLASLSERSVYDTHQPAGIRRPPPQPVYNPPAAKTGIEIKPSYHLRGANISGRESPI